MFVISTIFHEVQLLRKRASSNKKSLVDTSLDSLHKNYFIYTHAFIVHLYPANTAPQMHRLYAISTYPTLFVSPLSRLRIHSFLIHEILNCFKPKTEIIDIYESKMTITINKLLYSASFSRI